jgi:predicted molibdopterin-dependent oxidoreductase YjgC
VSTRVKQTVELLSSAQRIALVLPAGLSPETFALVQELAGLLPKVTFYPVVMRGNLQGALDMGVLPNCLPGYRSIVPESAACFGQAWNAKIPEGRGMNAEEMLSGIEHGNLSALYIMGDDPLGSDPRLAPVFGRLEFLVVQDIFMTETAKLADVVLPAASFLERSGTITTIERRLRHLAAAVEPLPDARPDWQILQAIASRMGVPLDYASEAAVMKEIRTLVPLYEDLSMNGCWDQDRSPVSGTTADLWFSSSLSEPRERDCSAGGLFCSGMLTSRSEELERIRRATIRAI